MQGTYPVISLSFARIKETNYDDARERILQIVRNLYIKFLFLKDSHVLEKADKAYFERILGDNVSNPDLTAPIVWWGNVLREKNRSVFIMGLFLG